MRLARPAIILAFALLTTLPDRSPAQDARPADPPKAEFAGRRRALMAKVKEAESRRPAFGAPAGEPVIVIRGADERRGEDYEEGRFRQSNTFEYLTGVEVPGSALILLPNSGQETLYLPPPGGSGLGAKRALKPGPDAAESLGFAKVESTGRFLADLFGALNDPGRPAGMRSARPVLYTTGTAATNTESSDAKFVRFVKEGAPSTAFKEVAPIVAELRKNKSAPEMALLGRAIAITGEAQAEVIRTLRPGLGENQIEAKILAAFLDGGAMRPAFASIVGSGPNSTIPHYFDNDRTMAEGDLVVVDIGAEYRYYAADITRTYPVGGKFTPRQREIYQLVLDAQSDAASRIKPGSTQLMPMTMGVREFFRKSPLRAKGEDGREYTMDHFFIHGLGHYLGMDVHDVGDYSKALQVGEVFTIEPGIYIPSENLGVRIEDDYVVTKDGVERISASIPSAPDEIERRMAEAKGMSQPK